MKYTFLLAGLCWFQSYTKVATQDPKFIPRVYFKARLEPRKQVLHGAGQSNTESFTNYTAALTPQTRPVLNMQYLGLKSNSIAQWFEKKQAEFGKYPWLVIPQIGLSMTKDGSPEEHYEDKIDAGEYDAQIEALCLALKKWDVPCYLRIGYEFNGQWNGYEPESFRKAFIRITEALRRHKLDKVATVWCSATDGKDKNFMAYYPGDAYVDWWGIDLFGETHFTDPFTRDFLDASLQHRKPLMIGESTPRRVGVAGGQASWNRWFAPYFNLIRSQPNLKAFCYINWNWAGFPMWADWGDARLEASKAVRDLYLQEMNSSWYLHGASSKKTNRRLGL